MEAACVSRTASQWVHASEFHTNAREDGIERIYVVIADDHSEFRQVLQGVIEAELDITVVAAVGDGAAALEAARRCAPDVALLDVHMPRHDGIEVARVLLDEQPAVRTVIMTMHWDHSVIERAVSAGASGFMAKETALIEVIAAIRSAVRGDVYVSPSLAAAFPNHRGTHSRP